MQIVADDDKDRRRKAHQLEFIWKPSTSLPSTAIFASAFPNHYNFRVGFDERDHQGTPFALAYATSCKVIRSTLNTR